MRETDPTLPRFGTDPIPSVASDFARPERSLTFVLRTVASLLTIQLNIETVIQSQPLFETQFSRRGI